MEAVQQLMREHRQIERVLAALGHEMARVRAGAAPNLPGWEAAVSFLEKYETGLHHEKEDVLFAALRKSGLSHHDPVLERILHEHVRGKALRAEIRAALAACGTGSPDATEALLHATAQFNTLLVEHIGKEDDFLYPMAVRKLPPRMLEKLPAAYAQLDREYGGSLAAAATEVERVLAAPTSR